MSRVERAIRSAVQQVNSEIRLHPLTVLTESDVQCRLYAALEPTYGSCTAVSNTSVWGTERLRRPKSVMSARLHSELLLPEGRIDLAILDLRATRFAFNSKGRFGHAQLVKGHHAFIEIKISRTHRSEITSKNRWGKAIRADLAKLDRYPWLSFLLAYDFNFGLSQEEIKNLRKLAGAKTRLIYLKDVFRNDYLEAAAEQGDAAANRRERSRMLGMRGRAACG